MERTLGLRKTSLVPLLFLLMAGTAAALTPEQDDEATCWRSRVNHAFRLVNDGKAAEARILLQPLFPAALRDTETEVSYLEALAWAAHKRNESAEALTRIAQAYTLASQKHRRRLARVLVTRMIIDAKNANAPKWGLEAIQLAEKYGEQDVEIRARGQLARRLAQKERFDEAIAMWEPALVKARALGNPTPIEQLEGNLGWAYFELGDYENADEHFTLARDTANKIGHNDAVIWTYQLGNVRMQQGDPRGAEQQFRAAYDRALKTKHEQTSIILALLANHQLRAGRHIDAQNYADDAIREAREGGVEDDELRALMIAGRIATARGRLAYGESLLLDVLARTTFTSIKAEAHGRLAELHVKAKRFGAAEDHFEKSIAQIHEARASVDNMELRFSYFNAVTELFESYVDFLMERGRHEEALAVTETRRAQTLERARPEPRDARVLARLTGATILCYWLGQTKSYLWIITPQNVSAVPLPPRETIEDLLDKYRIQLQGNDALTAGDGATLWRMLVQPAVRSIGSRAIIIPDGGLHAFNMETLVVPSPQPHYWIKDVILSNAGSLGMLGPKRSPHRASERLLLVGNSPPPNEEFDELPKAGEEMEKVTKHFGPARTVVLSGSKATPSAYRAKLPGQFAYLHFVAHGHSTRRKPLDSAVVLAKEAEDFKLYARDIAKQPLTAKLVTISSCHSAGTRSYAGEGLVGLGWAFLHAGAENVIAALWEVNDSAAPQLMDAFYAKLVSGADPATALRDAKLSLLNRGPVMARPELWAPFLLYGS